MTNDYNLRIRKIAVIENGGRKTSDVLKSLRMPYKIISISTDDRSRIMSSLLDFAPDVVVIDTDSRSDFCELANQVSRTLFATNKRMLTFAIGGNSNKCPSDLFILSCDNKKLAIFFERAVRISELFDDDLLVCDMPTLSRVKFKSTFKILFARRMRSVKRHQRSFR